MQNLIDGYDYQTNKPIDINSLADICGIKIDSSLPVEEKMKSYLRQIKNPHLYRCGDIITHVSFANTDVSLADRLKQYLLSGQGLVL